MRGLVTVTPWWDRSPAGHAAAREPGIGSVFPGRAPQLRAVGQRWPDRNTSMKRFLLAALLLTSACGSSEPTVTLSNPPTPQPSSSKAPATSAKGATRTPAAVHRVSPTRTSVPVAPSTRAVTPSPAETILSERYQAYMLALEAIQPSLSSNEKLAIARGNAVCDDLRAGASYDDLVSYTKKQFSDDPHHAISRETAAAVYEAVHSTICPS